MAVRGARRALHRENLIVDGDLAGWVVRTTGTHTGDGLGFPATGKPFETVTPTSVGSGTASSSNTGPSRESFRCSPRLG